MFGWTTIQVHSKKSTKASAKELHRQQQFRDQQRKSTPPPKRPMKT